MRESLTVFAPAKVNLYLHVTGRRADGYHLLDSLIVFADIGDDLVIAPCSAFDFRIQGPYAHDFTAADSDSSLSSANLVVRAATALAAATGHGLNLRLTLTKNLPLASGLGGGSADAAAVLRGLMRRWDVAESSPFLPDLLRGLGTELPACMHGGPVRVRGIGDVFDAVSGLPQLPVVLVNPGCACPTPEIFQRFAGPMRSAVTLPPSLCNPDALLLFLAAQGNDLSLAACTVVPEIAACLAALKEQNGCALARMSGSGATVFGLFGTIEQAQVAAKIIRGDHSDWWVQAGMLNSYQPDESPLPTGERRRNYGAIP